MLHVIPPASELVLIVRNKVPIFFFSWEWWNAQHRYLTRLAAKKQTNSLFLLLVLPYLQALTGNLSPFKGDMGLYYQRVWMELTDNWQIAKILIHNWHLYTPIQTLLSRSWVMD